MGVATRISTLAAIAVVALAPSAFAQATASSPRPAAPASGSTRWPSEGFFTLSAGAQFGDQTFADTHSEPLNGEQFTWTADYDVKTNFEFEVGGGWRVWRNLALGATYTYFNDSREAAITGSVPHPFYFEQPRTISGESSSLPHQEHGIHITATWMIPAGKHLEIGVFGGPSIFFVNQEFVDKVEFTEEYPYDTAAFSRAQSSDASETAFGAHGGVDVTWLITPTIGVGGVMRYSRSSVDFDTPGGGTAAMDVGGLQVAAGLRFRFNKPAPVKPTAPPPARTVPGMPAAPAGSKPAAGDFGTAITTARAPFFLRPDATRTPLRQLPVDTRLRVLEDAGEWLRVEYNDPQYGRRVGYIQRSFVRIDR